MVVGSVVKIYLTRDQEPVMISIVLKTIKNKILVIKLWFYLKNSLFCKNHPTRYNAKNVNFNCLVFGTEM